MIGHPAIGVDLVLIAFYAGLQDIHPAIMVVFVEENRLPGISTQNDVEQAAGYVKPRFARHRKPPLFDPRFVISSISSGCER